MFTKVYKEEDVRLRGCSYNVASVYFHLKNKRDYFKSKNNGSCYDLTKHISKNTGICEKTIKRAIATLRELGLISTVIKGKVNHYSFPILDAIENNTPIEEVIKDIPSKPKKKQIEPEIENKPILTPQIIQDDNQHHPEGESASNGLKIGKNEVLKDDNENNIDDMGNLLVFNQTTEKYEYPNKTKEEIKEKVIKNSLPTVHIAATAQTPSIPTFEEVLKDEKDTIEDIIKDFNAGGMKARLQAPTRLNELLNRKWGRYYKEQITEYINNRRVA